ncbi:MAG: globin domain-containing protein [Pseudomonadota bacterium]
MSPIRESYERIAPRAPDVIEDLYRRLFARAPETRSMFKAELGNQYGKFAATLELCVMAEADPTRLRVALDRLSERHVGRGVAAAHYPIFIDCFVEAMAAQIGDDWTEAYDTAWRAALTEISARMTG